MYRTSKDHCYLLIDRDGSPRLVAENAQAFAEAVPAYIKMIYGEGVVIGQRWTESFIIFCVNGKDRYFGESMPYIRNRIHSSGDRVLEEAGKINEAAKQIKEGAEGASLKINNLRELLQEIVCCSAGCGECRMGVVEKDCDRMNEAQAELVELKSTTKRS